MATTAAGYSHRSLAEKLGLKPGMSLCILRAPQGFVEQLGTVKEKLAIHTSLQSDCDVIHLFMTEKDQLHALIPKLLTVLSSNTTLWVSWPKRSSGVQSDVSENSLRDILLPHGLVDVKVIAVDAVWSGLKFVYRKTHRHETR